MIREVVGPAFRKIFALAIAISDSAALHAGAVGGFDIGGRIAYKQTLVNGRAQSGQSLKNNVGMRFSGKAVSALYVIEIGKKTEALQDEPSSRGTFRSGCRLAAAQS